MVFFSLADIPRILPEILLIVLALLVLGSDIFEKWGRDEAAQLERSRSAGSLTAIGLGLIFVIALVQSGYVFKFPADAPTNFFTNIVRNLQSGGPGGIPILGAFATDHLTMIARLTFIGSALLVSLLLLDFRPTGNPGELYGLILFSTAGMCLMAAANEFIIAYLAVELTSIPLYVLAGYFSNDKKSSEAGMKYLLFGALSSGILLYGMSLTYGFAANILNTGISANNLTQFNRIAEIAASAGENTMLLTLGMIFVIAGAGYKIAVVPFHAWSPDVYQGAPTPITAFISTASKTAGFILLGRLLVVAFPALTGSAAILPEVVSSPAPAELGGWTSLLALLALITMIVGNLAALSQSNAKRLLAWSSIAHAGYLLMGLIAFGSPQAIDRQIGVSSLLYYLIVYSITNIGAFGALAVIEQSTGSADVSNLNGLARRNLGLAALLLLSVLSLAGVPPLAGFFAKFYIFMGAWQGGAWLLVSAGVVTTIISLYYYLRLLKAIFITAPSTDAPLRLPPAMGAAITICALLLLVVGIFPNFLLGVISQVQAVAGL